MSDFDDEIPGLNDQLDALPNIETQAEPAEDAAAENPLAEEKKDEKKATKRKKSRGLPPYFEWSGVLAACLAIVAVGCADIVSLPTSVFILSLALISYALWKGRRTNNAYTVILACTLVAILTAIYCLWIELDRYNYDIKARDKAKRSVSLCRPTAPNGYFSADLLSKSPAAAAKTV